MQKILRLLVCVNGVLDYVLVQLMGIAGAAWATVAAQLLSALCCWAYLRRRYPELLCTGADAGWHRPLVRDTLRFGMTSALHQSSIAVVRHIAVNVLKNFSANMSLARKRRRCAFDDSFFAAVLASVHA